MLQNEIDIFPKIDSNYFSMPDFYKYINKHNSENNFSALHFNTVSLNEDKKRETDNKITLIFLL